MKTARKERRLFRSLGRGDGHFALVNTPDTLDVATDISGVNLLAFLSAEYGKCIYSTTRYSDKSSAIWQWSNLQSHLPDNNNYWLRLLDDACNA